MYQNHRQHPHTWPHRGRTWGPPTRSYAYCPQIWLQSTENTCEGPSHQISLAASTMPMVSTWTWQGQCCTCLASTHQCHWTPRILRSSHIPKSLHPWSVHLDYPSARAAQEGHKLHMELHLWHCFWVDQGSRHQWYYPQVLRPLTPCDNTGWCLTGRPWYSTPAKWQTHSLCQQGPHQNWTPMCKHRERDASSCLCSREIPHLHLWMVLPWLNQTTSHSNPSPESP